MACYNDSDTYLTELRDNLDLTNSIIGRFTIYPPEYYKKRIEIQTQILKKNPSNLDAYDSIAVACDRIGNSNDALRWINEKKKHYGKDPGKHLYTTEANEGTFLIHRWVRGHKPGDMTDAIAAETHIFNAIRINPDAHFGREFAQLYCIRAIIQSGKGADWMPTFTENLIQLGKKDGVDRRKLRYGIAGMMVLGNAWNSPVMIQAIAELVPEEGQVASLCKAKLHFLQNTDERFMGKDLKGEFPIVAKSTTHGSDRTLMEQLLRNGQEFRTGQDEFIEKQLAVGKHPDKGDDFWQGFKAVPPVPKEKLASSTFISRSSTFILNSLMDGSICCTFIPLGILFLGIRSYRRRRAWNAKLGE